MGWSLQCYEAIFLPPSINIAVTFMNGSLEAEEGGDCGGSDDDDDGDEGSAGRGRRRLLLLRSPPLSRADPLLR